MCNVSFDIVKLFAKNSRHSVKIGGGGGLAFEQDSHSFKEKLNNGHNVLFVLWPFYR